MAKGCGCFMCHEMGDPELCIAPAHDHVGDATRTVDAGLDAAVKALQEIVEHANGAGGNWYGDRAALALKAAAA